MTTHGDTPGAERAANRLANETSPYLLQHRHNPVDWHPWGDEAFEKARRENKPLLISIGYSACHWCHVMERESFENPDIARLVNETVVPVKVDREERPDVDAIYMNACVAMTGQGGWPLNAFVTPDLKPFFVGTYFPPDDRWGRAGFPTVVRRIREAWDRDRLDLVKQASALQDEIDRYGRETTSQPIHPDVWEHAVNEAANQFDLQQGGFGGAPKFPPDQRLAMLLAVARDTDSEVALRMVERTLDAMARGGIYDQLGGGFARYSVDAEWLIPHFEKMLYNQALLAPLYLDAHLATGRPDFLATACETLDWVLRDMRSPGGMFFSALDADSEGVEGRFYVWTPAEVAAILGDGDADLFCRFYDVTQEGNFEHGASALRVLQPLEEFAEVNDMDPAPLAARLETLRGRMLAARSRRVPPGLDDKCITAWNGLMISALCRGHQVTGKPEYLSAAGTAADFVLKNLRPEPARLLRIFCKGRAHVTAVLEDYAFFTAALIDLHETCFDRRYLDSALELAEATVKRFADSEAGGFYLADGADASLIQRTRESHDGALPAGASVAAMNFLRLGSICDRADLTAVGVRAIEHAGPRANRVPGAFSALLLAERFRRGPTPQIVVVGEPDDPAARDLVGAAWKSYLPARVIVRSTTADDPLPLASGKWSPDGAAFVCVNSACNEPARDVRTLIAQLSDLFE